MRVLHVVPSLDPDTGGPARSVPALCRALQQAGVEVALYSFRRASVTATVNGDEPYLLRWFKPFLGTRQFPTTAFYRALCSDLPMCDLAHLHSLWNGAVEAAALACRRSHVPYVISPRGMLQATAAGRKGWLKASYDRLSGGGALTGARLVHFFTLAEARDSQGLLAGRAAGQVVIPNGVETLLGEGVQPGQFRKAHPNLWGKQVMLFLGRLHWSKGLELQLQALAKLAAEFPDLMWVLVGPDEGAWTQLARSVKKQGLEGRVVWTGLLPREQCLEALADADLFLLTSRHEAHSVAMNEALAVGVPTILTDTVQFDEVAEWGAGLVVPWGPEALAGAIAQVLQNTDKATNMRKAAREAVAQHLAWPKVAEAMARTYQEILDGVAVPAAGVPAGTRR